MCIWFILNVLKLQSEEFFKCFKLEIKLKINDDDIYMIGHNIPL